MKKMCFIAAALLLVFMFSSCGTKGKMYAYEKVPSDPLNARIYTLENGLKVYLTVNKDEPRIQTSVAVRVGGKNDPAETTGLAHYFEHIMFKGTQHFGTKDYAAEEPYLNQIENLFEIYRQTKDEKERAKIYKQIDSFSYEASKISIPNEYDKLMTAIGAEGTNAYTAYDMTVYLEDIPSNEVENWAKIQYDRFSNPVIRGFHTELETVYEEKNMSLTRDPRKVSEAISSALFLKHPYGTQTVLGTQEHLKNPSITNIKNYFKKYYVPNNMAICMSGDFDPDSTIAIIDQYFGKMQRGEDVKFEYQKEDEIKQPIVKEVLGNDAENISLAWRCPGAKELDIDKMNLIQSLLYNGVAGLLDLNVVQKQKVLNAYAYLDARADYSILVMTGFPKQGQTLDEVKAIFLEQIDSLKGGKYPDWMLEATINNYKLMIMKSLESNASRCDMLVSSFVNGTTWKDEVESLDRMSKITKLELMDYAKLIFRDNYAEVKKKQGRDPKELKIAKPMITPIVMNRDTASPFLKEIQNSVVSEIEPVFIDFKKDISHLQVKQQIPVLYRQNTTNDLFELYYIYDMGSKSDRLLGYAFSYLKYLGTSKYSPEEIKSQFYRLGCDFSIGNTPDRVYVSLSGLNSNMDKALDLLESLINDCQANDVAFTNLIMDEQKERIDAKFNQRRIFFMLQEYAKWGKKSPSTNDLSAEELKNLKAEELIQRIRSLQNYEHTIVYYGPKSEKEIKKMMDEKHLVAAQLKPVLAPAPFQEQITSENKVLFVHYQAKQLYMSMLSKKGEKFNPSLQPKIDMYNEYFSGGMNSIVFQEMREARALAYTAYAFYSKPSRLDQTYTFLSFIATQNDKLSDAITAFDQIINTMPESENAFKLAQNSLLSRIRTQRINRSSILWYYIQQKDLGLDYDTRKDLFTQLPGMSLKSLKEFQEAHIKGRTYTYCILGDQKDLTPKKMEKYGKVQVLSLEDVFGY